MLIAFSVWICVGSCLLFFHSKTDSPTSNSPTRCVRAVLCARTNLEKWVGPITNNYILSNYIIETAFEMWLQTILRFYLTHLWPSITNQDRSLARGSCNCNNTTTSSSIYLHILRSTYHHHLRSQHQHLRPTIPEPISISSGQLEQAKLDTFATMMFQRSTLISLIAASISCHQFTSLLPPVHAFAMHGNGRSRWGPPITSTTKRTSSSSSSSSSSLQATIDDTGISTTTSSVTTADILSLDSIRSTLIRQEETIIFAIIERAQYRQNNIIYEDGGFGDLGLPLGCNTDECALQAFVNKDQLSFLDYMLIGTVSLAWSVEYDCGYDLWLQELIIGCPPGDLYDGGSRCHNNPLS